MKYLDNLIAWGDSLFLADTIETHQRGDALLRARRQYPGPAAAVRAAAGRAPPHGTSCSSSRPAWTPWRTLWSTWKRSSLSTSCPTPAVHRRIRRPDRRVCSASARSLYFCVPPNPQLLAYWDTVADRLFKIRNSENIQGVVQQLPLFDPPIDPGMLVKAAAAGIDIGSIVSGLNQPIGPVRSPLLIQKSLEIAAEVRSLGNALLSALEKGDAEQLALLRQGHEINSSS